MEQKVACPYCRSLLIVYTGFEMDKVKTDGCPSCIALRASIVRGILQRSGLRPDDPWLEGEVESEAEQPLPLEHVDEAAEYVTTGGYLECPSCGHLSLLGDEWGDYCVVCGYGLH